MKKGLVILSGAAIALSISAVSAAGGAYQAETPTYNAWDASITGMYARSSENHAMYSQLSQFSGGTLQTKLFNMDSKYELGGGANISYTFKNRSDIEASFLYLGPKETGKVGQSFYVGPLQITPTTKNEAKWSYDQGNLDMGQTFQPSKKLILHPFIGLGYRHANHDATGVFALEANYQAIDNARTNIDVTTNTQPPPPRVANIGIALPQRETSTFNGLGPRVGMDGVYAFRSWLGIVSDAVFTLPYGQTKGKSALDIYLSNQNLTWNSKIATTDTQKVDTFVPELDAQFAIRLSNDVTNSKRTNYYLDIGYRVIHLWNGYIDVTDSVSNVNTTGTPTYQLSSGYKFQDVTFSGPYLKGGVHFNM